MGQGNDLGAARGRLEIDVSQLEAARAAVQAFATGTSRTLTGINSSVNAASASFTTLTNSVRQLAGAFGISLGVAGIVQLGKMAIASAEVATAYNRQKVAAEGLAGSQQRLNELLAVYDKATGGIVTKVDAMANVTKLMAVGFADSAKELDQVARAIRGISIAMGETQDFVTQNLILESFSQQGKRLDQLGLEYDKVRQRADELQAADSRLTEKMAYQQAILEIAKEKFGKLADSADGAGTALEGAQKKVSDLGLQFGELVSGPINLAATAMSALLDNEQQKLDGTIALVKKLGDAIRELPQIDLGQLLAQAAAGGIAMPRGWNPTGKSFAGGGPLGGGGSGGGKGGFGGGSLGPTDEQKAVITSWNQERIRLEQQTGQQIADATEQYGSERATTIAEYEKQIARGAEDYGRQRAEAEANLQEAIASVAIDGARQRERWERDLAQAIGEAQRDSAERVADLQIDHDERIGDAREDSAKRIAGKQADLDDQLAKDRKDSQERLAEIERDYNSDREKAAADHGLRMADAAMRNDGRAFFQENARYNLETKAAADAHQEAISKEQEHLGKTEQERKEAFDKAVAEERANLQDRIDAENKSYKKRIADEAESLAKSIDQQNEANAQRLADAAAADAQRVKDIQDAYDKEKAQAETEYGIRLTRAAQDHDDQLKAMDDEHDKRITQIQTHAADEREALDTEFKTQLSALSLQVDGWSAEMTRATNNAMLEYDRWLKHLRESLTDPLLGPVTNPGLDPALDDRRQFLQTSITGWKIQQVQTKDQAEIKRLQDLIDIAQGTLDKLNAGGPSVDASSFGMMSSAAFHVAPMPAMASASAMGGSNRSLTVGDIHVTINGVSTNTANDILDVVDKRILHQIQVAAGRM